MGKGRRNEHAVILQNPADLGKGFLRLRHDVQRVGHDHHVEGLVRIRQAEHILHRKVQLRRLITPLCFKNHLRRCVRGLDMRRRIHDVLCDQPRAACQLQHRLGFHHRLDQLIHLFVCRPILSHKAVVPTGISVPEGLSFTHGCLSPHAGIFPPLPGVFQQGGTRRTKRLAPCPMHTPAIPMHHEGNSFDLLFLVQAPNSFLLCISVSSL